MIADLSLFADEDHRSSTDVIRSSLWNESIRPRTDHSDDHGAQLYGWLSVEALRRVFPNVRHRPSNDIAAFARGLSDLTIVGATDLAAVRSWVEFGKLLSRLKSTLDMSLSDIELRAKRLQLRRPLPRATVSEAMNGRRPSKEVLGCLLEVLDVPSADYPAWHAAWERLAEVPPAGRTSRFDEVSPRQLGIHAAITAEGSGGELPEYVSRDFDDYLQERISAGINGGCFVLLVGRSSSGKTRSLYEAVRVVAPNWPIVQPAGTKDIAELLDGPKQKIIVWLDEMHRFFGGDPRLTKEHVIRLEQFPAIVVGTLWSDDYVKRKTPLGPAASAALENDRRLLDLADIVSVPDVLSSRERANADGVAKTDSRIRHALQVKDAGLTQVLAAGPDLLRRWEHAPDPYAKAVVSFAADARRLGVLAPLSESAFESAVAGYLTPSQRIHRPERWLADALAYGIQELHGAVSALAPADDGRAGTLAGYVVADYVAQHIRRTDCPPHTAWETLIGIADDGEDLRRLALAAKVRLRYCHEEQALRRLFDLHGEGVLDLAEVLYRNGREQEATDLLVRHLVELPDDRSAIERLEQIVDRSRRIDELRAAAAGGDLRAGRRLAEIFVDGGTADDLRTRADAGSLLADDDLAALLAERGEIDELRERADRGSQPAGNYLAELLATHGRVDLLQQRSDAGDQAAARQLAKLLGSQTAADGPGVQTQLADLRQRIGSGDEAAARQLPALLFDLRSMTELKREVDAGTFQAAERFIALMSADETVDRVAVDHIRTHGLDADGSPYAPQVP